MLSNFANATPRIRKILVLFAGTFLSGLILTGSTADGDEPSLHERGRELFQREWQPSNDDLTEAGALEPDGLGPMFNANSCVACHVKGGGADIDHNVTLLTLDPRSPLIDGITKKRGSTLFNGSSSVAREVKLTATTKLKTLHPSLVDAVGKVSLEVVVHDFSIHDTYQAARSALMNGVPDGVPVEWFDPKTRTSESIALQPVIPARVGDLDYYLSQRNSPPLFGMGLIDKVSIQQLRKLSGQQSKQSDGQITGRIGAGKFGWRGQTSSLSKFVSGACAAELGLQLEGTPQPADAMNETYVSFGVDMNKKQVAELEAFVRALPAPSVSGTKTHPGRKLFSKVGCADCHVENVRPAMGLYSDLLLHDMGKLLQAPSPAPLGDSNGSRFVKGFSMERLEPNRNVMRVFAMARAERKKLISVGEDGNIQSPPLLSPNAVISSSSYNGGPSRQQASGIPSPYPFARAAVAKFPAGNVPERIAAATNAKEVTWDTLQREWRTPPLWGLADSAPYLHDGRALTIDAAIRWHAGEAAPSTSKYLSLEKPERQQLLSFLQTLKAPTSTRTPALISTRR